MLNQLHHPGIHEILFYIFCLTSPTFVIFMDLVFWNEVCNSQMLVLNTIMKHELLLVGFKIFYLFVTQMA